MRNLRIAGFALALLATGFATGVRAETVSVTFLLVNDIHEMDAEADRGGFARLAAVVKQERASGGHVIYAHAGDTISPSLFSGFNQGEHVIDLLNSAPLDIFVPGNHEYDFGPEVFLERLAQAEFPWFAANLRDSNGEPIPGIEDSRIFEFDGVKVGVLGLTADDAPVKSSPGDFQFQPTVAFGQQQAAALRDAGADFVALVVHANRAQDRELYTSGAFDLILTGDDHDLYLNYNGRTAIAESGEEGERLTAIDVTFDVTEDDDGRTVDWVPNFRIIDTAGVEPDAAVAEKIAAYEAELSSELDVVIGTTTTEIDSRRISVRAQETAIGNLITDAMREAVGADVAITNGGGIRGNKTYPAGTELTRRDVLTELPFGNKTVLLEIAGADIIAALENGFSEVENGAGRFPHVSGMTVEADLSAAPGSRVTSVQIGGNALDPAATYTLATNDFMGRGGDGYTALEAGTPVLGTLDAKLMANDVMAYIRSAGTISPAVEGRISLN